MFSSSFVLAAALLLSAAGASAQSFVSTTPDQPLGSAASKPGATAGTQLYTQHFASGGSITYFGATHSHDAQHEQFARLRRAFETSRPSTVFFEGPDLGIDTTEGTTIEHLGEGGYARYLAQQHRVAAERLDDPIAEYEYLQARTEAEPLKLYYLLHHMQQFRERTGASQDVAIKALKSLIASSSYFVPGTEHVIRNYAEFKAAYQKYCPGAGWWSQAPASWFNPNIATAGPAGSFTASINRYVAEFRAQQLYHKLAEKAEAGQQVFVVMAPDRVPAALSLASQRPAK